MTERTMTFPKGIEQTLKHVKEVGLKRLQKRTIIDKETNCWIWQGDETRGHGRIKIDYIHFFNHRISMFLYNDNFDLINGPQVNHKCNNKLCWNPEHLYIGTSSQNQLDSVKAGTNANAIKTHCPQGHEYNEENTYTDKHNLRHCRQCARERSQFKRDNE